MGKGRKNKPKKNFAEKRREKQKKKDEWDTTPHHNYEDIVRENKDFENYYKTQKIVPEEQWDSFINTMRKNLPVAFRLTGSKTEAKALMEKIKGDFFKEILNTHMQSVSKDVENNAKDVKDDLKDIQNDSKDVQKDSKDSQKDLKDIQKDSKDVQKDSKDSQKDLKDIQKDSKDVQKDSKDGQKDLKNDQKESKEVQKNSEDTQNNSKDMEEAKDILQCLPFYPDGLAWQLQLTRKDIRRSEAYFRLHNFLIVETESGNISRQEVVSMVPPLVLDVKPSHKVLDMCAAPGSKTAQLIEMIHSEEGSALPEGFVIANDLDNNRCYMLVHQAKRLNSPFILITNHDASILPNFTTTKPDDTKEELKFDRILADVPCSGDGTMRKNPDIWCKWSPANGNNLHGVQYRIARRGLELLAVGGRMVYSTCSLNPIENEAVLHRLLLETQDSVHLVDCRDLVPGLVCDPGISHWSPASKDLQYYKSWEDVPENWQTQVHPKMFPPKPEDAVKFHFERCMRILPHHQDTGGFFVAILEKVKNLPWESKATVSDEIAQKSNSKDAASELSLEEEAKKKTHGKRSFDEMNKLREARRKRRRIAAGYKEDPFVFFKDDKEDAWLSIKNFYNISDELDPRCLLVRCLGRKKKNIYYTSPEIRNVVLSNEDQIKLINTGVKSFVRCDNKNMDCAFRLAQEGIQSIIKYIGDGRKIKVTKDDLIMLLQNFNPHTPPEIVKLNTETQERLQNFATGSCILVYEEEKTENPLKLQMVGWRGTMSLRAYVPVHDAIHYLRLLGADCSKFEKNKFKENRDAVASEESKNEVANDSKKDDAKTEVSNDSKKDDDTKFEDTNDSKKVDGIKLEVSNDSKEGSDIKTEVTNDSEKDVSIKIEDTNNVTEKVANIKTEVTNDITENVAVIKKEVTNDVTENVADIKKEITKDVSDKDDDSKEHDKSQISSELKMEVEPI